MNARPKRKLAKTVFALLPRGFDEGAGNNAADNFVSDVCAEMVWSHPRWQPQLRVPRNAAIYSKPGARVRFGVLVGLVTNGCGPRRKGRSHHDAKARIAFSN